MPQTAEAFLDQQAPDAEAFLDDAPSAEKFIESSVSRMADATRATVGVVGRAVAAFDMAQAGASGETQPSAPEAVSTDEFGRPLDPRGLNPSGPNPAAPTRLIGSEGLAPLLAPLIPLRKAFSQGEQLSYLASQQPEGAARQTLAVAGGVVSGVEDVVGGAMEFMTSPVGIATMGLGAAPGALRAVASGTFAADMLSHAPDSLREFQAATTPEAKARALTAGLGNLAMAGVAASHAYGEAYKALAKPKTPLEQVAPLTAEAVAKVPRADLATVEPAIEVKPPEILSPTPLTTEAVAKVVEKEPVPPPAPTPPAAEPGATVQTKSEGEQALTYREKADALALKLEGLKSGIGGGTTGQTNAFGILPDLWDRAVSVAQGILRAGGSAADVVEAFIKHVKDNFKDPFDEEGARQHLTGVLTTESPEPVTYGIAARVSEERARKGKIGVIEPGEGIAAKDSVEQGRALLAAGADPQMVLSEFERTKSVSSEGMAVARAHGETLAIAAENAADQFGIESPEYKAAAKADEDWLRKLKPMQTEWHKIGQAQQGETDINTGSFHGLRRAFFEATDKEFTPKQTVDAQGIAKGVGDAKGAADTAKAKLNDHFKTPLPKERMTDAEKRAIDAANKTVREAAARLAAAEAKRITTDKARQMAAEKLAKAAELSAQTAAERAVRNNAIRLAKADEKAAIKQADLAKKAADAARTAEEKAKSAVDKWHREAAVREAKAEQADLNDPSREVWRRAKEYLNKGEDRFDEIRTKIATDMGLPVEQVTRLLIKDQRAKYLADDLWRKQQKYRQLHEQAKRWLTNQETPFYQRALASIPRAMFGLKVGFHGTVALGTHAPTVAFQPRFWKAYVRDFGKMYKMVGSKAYYEQQVQDLMRRKNYITARRAGLVNDPFQYEDFNSPDTAKYFGNLTGMGNRGYSVLKILRQDMFDQHWDKLPRTAQIPEMAEAISDAINHATGVVKGSAPKGANVALFAPRLEASRVMWLAGDPLRAADTFLRWNKATPAEKYFAVNQVKEKAWVVGTYLSLLALNQGFLSATGSNQQVNMTDPFHSDWLKFKAAGMNMSYGNAMITMARLPVRLYKIRSSDGGKLKNLIYPDEDTYSVLGEYARSQASPFASLAATLWFRGDWQGRQLPNSNRPMPKRLKAQGITPYTWTEFWTEQILPIPAEEAARDVWRHGLGMSEDQIQHALKAMATIAVMSGTGARLVEDVPYKKK